MRAIFVAAAVATIASADVTPAAGDRLRDGAVGVIGYAVGPDIARGVNPRDRGIHEDPYHDGASDGHRSAGR